MYSSAPLFKQESPMGVTNKDRVVNLCFIRHMQDVYKQLDEEPTLREIGKEDLADRLLTQRPQMRPRQRDRKR